MADAAEAATKALRSIVIRIPPRVPIVGATLAQPRNTRQWRSRPSSCFVGTMLARESFGLS
jgi:hypothetical protein